jgi:predicted RNA-binding Zn-ribbon protein involved in translation (DUF1610 family)
VTAPTSGWSAECQHCDYTIEPDYGARVYPRSESSELADVEHWANEHAKANPGHQPQIGQFHRFTLDIREDVRDDVLEALFGQSPRRQLLGVGDPRAVVEDQDVALDEPAAEPTRTERVRRVEAVRDAEGFIVDGDYSAWDCDRCGSEVRRYRGQSDVDCPKCGACYNAGGQRLRDDWRGNSSNWDEDVDDLEGFERQQLAREDY